MNMEILSSHPFYIRREDINIESFNRFIDSVSEAGFFVERKNPKLVRISDSKENVYNNIFVRYPQHTPYCNELTICKFFNADGQLEKVTIPPPTTVFAVATSVASAIRQTLFSDIIYGNEPKNPERIFNEPFCNIISSLFLAHISPYRCENCKSYSFTKEIWEKKDPLFTEDRIGHMISAVGIIAFLRGHGAGGEWSRATGQRYRRKGFTLTCSKCGSTHSVITSTEQIS